MDEIDQANDNLESAYALMNKQVRARVAAMPKGEPGECRRCGEESLRLVHGNCARCRDKYNLT